MKIRKITATRIFDSRAIPTIQATVWLENGISASASVPSGASTGSYEAHEKRDGGSAYLGKDVSKAIKNVNGEINRLLSGYDVRRQRAIDYAMIEADGTENKSRLGGNALLAVSEAVARTAAKSLGIPLYQYLGGINGTAMPIPMMNILNGGLHAPNNADIQEFMIMPIFSTFEECMEAGTVIYRLLGQILKAKGKSTSIGDEGGYAPDVKDDREGIELLLSAVLKSGFDENRIKIALDAAANEWRNGETYLTVKTKRAFSSDSLVRYWKELAESYPIISIEDPFAEDDFESFATLTKELKDRVQIVGDDLFVTNVSRLNEGIKRNSGSAILIKPNQIGTVTETIAAVNLAKDNNYGTIISHRSGDTDDTFIADLSVGLNAGQIKTGAPARGERTAKYNRLINIEKSILRG